MDDKQGFSPVPLFVVGVGRSGTSLLQSMLAAHREIVSLPETGFFRRRILGRRDNARLSVDDWVALDTRLSRIGTEGLAEIKSALSARENDRPGAVELYEAIRYRFAAAGATDNASQKPGFQFSEPRYLLDKDPRLIEYLRPLFIQYPTAQVVHIVRDPRDVLLSKQQAEWSAGRPWWLNFLIGVAQLDRFDRGLTAPEAWRVITVRYEEIITEPERVLRRIAHELDLDYDPGMMSYGGVASALRGSDEASWKDNVSGPLLKGNADKWKRGMSPLRQAACDRLAGVHLRRGGYRRSDLPKRLHRVVATVVSLLLQPVRFVLGILVRRSARVRR